MFRFLVAILLMFAFCSCSKSGLPADGEAARVVLGIEAGDQPALTRAGNLSLWDQAVDGQGVFSAAAFLFKGNDLVAHTQVELPQLQSGAELAFGEDVPYGSYTLYVVANAAPYKEYSGLQGWDSALSGMVAGRKLTEEFAFFAINSQGGICETMPHPLTSVMQVELVPGTNHIEVQLTRSVARIRIAVENNSNETLEISTLSFSNPFTQQSAWLFPNKGFRMDKRCGITVTGQNAIVPFSGTWLNPVKIGAMGSTTVFDAYILESALKDGESGYSYTMGLTYETTSGTFMKDAKIPLQTIDAVTGQPEDVREICRNDFIDVTVKVSYSRNTGNIYFQVVPWNTGGGNIDFS